jgi:hypothetical protein
MATNNAADLSDPIVVGEGGTGFASTTSYGVLCGGTTSTGNLQNAGTGTSGQIFVSNGSGGLPSFSSSAVTLTGDITGSGSASISTTLASTISRNSIMTWNYGNNNANAFARHIINNANVTTFGYNFGQSVTMPHTGYAFQYYRPISLPSLQDQTLHILRYAGGITTNLMVFGADDRVNIIAGLNMDSSSIAGASKIGIGIIDSAINAALQFSQALSNRKIVLYETSNNEHQIFGFGINGGILRYQIDLTSAAHVFYAGTSSTTSNELIRIQGNGNVGIGTSSPNAPLQFSQATGNRKIVLYEGTNNNHQNYSIGMNANEFRFQVPATNDNFIFYAATSSTTSNEIMRIKGNGDVVINTGGTFWPSRVPSGCMYMIGVPTLTVITLASTYYKVQGLTTGVALDNFTHSNNRLTYTGGPTITAHVVCNINRFYQSRVSGMIVQFSLFKNGSYVNGATAIKDFILDNVNYGDLTFSFLVSLATNDYLELYVTGNFSGESVGVNEMQMTVVTT